MAHRGDVRAAKSPPTPAPERELVIERRTEARLVRLLASPETPRSDLLDALFRLQQEGGSIADLVPAGQERARRWSDLLARSAELGRRHTYVGDWRRTFADAVEIAAQLSPSDRSVAALYLLDRAADTASTGTELREALRGLRKLDPALLTPTSAVDVVLRTCIRHPHVPPARPAVETGLPITLEILATPGGPWLEHADLSPLRVLLDRMPNGLDPALAELVSRLHPRDRRTIENMLAPPRRRTFSWRGRRADQ